MTRLHLLLAGAVLAPMVGCDAPQARFRVDMVLVRAQDKTAREVKDGKTIEVEERISNEQVRELNEVLTALFGAPDDPRIPQNPEAGFYDKTGEPFLDINDLRRAAGPVKLDEVGLTEVGLYRQHCVHCHGVTGNGMGPTAAFLNPYPRDFRRGIFKFKRTPIESKPTDDDLRRTLVKGVHGTSMPSFKLLNAQELDSLIAYVKYLAIRGEVERRLIQQIVVGEPVFKLEAASKKDLFETVAEVVDSWRAASEKVVEAKAPPAAEPVSWESEQFKYLERSPEEIAKSVALGRQLFYGKFDCVSCHGPAGLGDGAEPEYAIWSQAVANGKKTESALTSEDRKVIARNLELGALPPRPNPPRNLRVGVYRGGHRPIDLFWRIRNGIEGTAMPPRPAASDEEIWAVVDYIRALPYEPASRPPADLHRPTLNRAITQ